MTDKQDSPKPLDSETVAAYLRLHPEFFIDHDELIPELRIPHQRGDTVSLVERQVKLLRERNIEMRHRLSQLMDVARDNDRLFDKTRRLVLDLLDASSLEEVVSCVEDSLRREFQVPFVSLILFSEAPLPVGRSVSSAEAHQAIGGLLAGGKTICGVLREHELNFLFGSEDGAQVGSAAVVSISYQGLHGVLAIGSADPQHYKSSLGTLFLGYIAEVLARVVPGFATPLRSVR
ncbi:MAG: DUF484 family protein [Gammaproteobacteria bacterium]|jgi:uncharacterized protein|uniref:DUF484 family protein n=1 Tax=Pseudomonas sp. TaxID=306 RepID=UPI001DB3686E|nr:DUF484 family protein [Pseudomonas sp.]MBU1285264.1 DUF484 family protein [Gammaproteobacteria bacterium]MBU2155678.1 DUF484 family protein [Gammaproteobacteria bacterium]MBU2257009.1 DUF484 family protein [Gammaproteobacteria bacterium]MBU2293422.1 DUF484 family protein [Gammaproteobacteria bacterium]MDO9616379.1 DUF484 family protein [Pseudomonas sp.]